MKIWLTNYNFYLPLQFFSSILFSNSNSPLWDNWVYVQSAWFLEQDSAISFSLTISSQKFLICNLIISKASILRIFFTFLLTIFYFIENKFPVNFISIKVLSPPSPFTFSVPFLTKLSCIPIISCSYSIWQNSPFVKLVLLLSTCFRLQLFVFKFFRIVKSQSENVNVIEIIKIWFPIFLSIGVDYLLQIWTFLKFAPYNWILRTIICQYRGF